MNTEISQKETLIYRTLLALALIVLAWHAIGHSAASLRVLMGLMVLFILGQAVWLGRHVHTEEAGEP